MAKSPLHWALGIAVAIGFGAVHFGEKLAGTLMLDGGGVASPGERAAAATSRPSVPQPPVPNPTLTVSADYSGHFMVHLTVESYRVRAMVDTGASVVALTARDARALGVTPSPGDFNVRMNTANGVVRGAKVNLREVRLGDILVRNVDAVVMPEGALSISLLGNSFLSKLRGYQVQSGRMVLRG